MDAELLPPDNELDKNLEILFNQFENSMLALQIQNKEVSEQSLIKAKNVYNYLSTQLHGDEILPFRVIYNLIDVTARLLRSIDFSYDERYKRSLEELDAAKNICNEAFINFNAIPKDLIDDEAVKSIISTLKPLFVFYDCIISSTRLTLESQIEANEGKFVDEVKVLKDSSKILRKINEQSFHMNENDISVMMIGLINKIAEVNEKRAEKLEEKRKKIEFIRPIDKKVFIVHGHNEGILGELKAMLSHAGIEPIVLSEMTDNGNTIIEKFENYARLCAFAFVIITPDDIVENKKKKYFQGRPNVLFELGWFCGRLGRDKVRILRQKDTQLPSDLDGLITINFHEKLEEVFRKINADLEKNGIIEARA